MNMKRFFISAALLFLSACQAAHEPPVCPLTPLDTGAQAELCRHYAGEDAYDAARAAYLKRKMEENNCELYF